MNSQTTDSPRAVSAAEARELVEEQRTSGLSIAAFARERGVKPWALYNARAAERRRATRGRASRFAEIQVVDEPAEAPVIAGGAIEVSLPSGVAIRVRRDFDEVALRRLLGVLGSC